MVTGRSPFGGRTPSDILVAILSQDAPPLTTAAPGTTAELQRIIAKALRKPADERYQSVKELLVDLKALSGNAPSGQRAAGARAVGRRVSGIALLAVLTIAAAFTGYRLLTRAPVLTTADTILLADFVNRTGDATFDGGTLKEALTVQLQQTPFLNLFPNEAIATTLAMMERPAYEHVTGAVAREICQRNGLKALVSGTIAKLGQHYVVTLDAVSAQSGATLAIQQGEAPDAEHVLQVLGTAATGLRGKLGETLATLQKYNAPIEQATTSSLEALKAYSAGMALMHQENGLAARPFFERAVALDPEFVAAYDNGAWSQAISGTARAPEWAAEGYQRRQRATELEQFSATATYHHFATGDLDEENKTCDVWVRLFPNDWTPYSSYAINYPVTGRLGDAADAGSAMVRLSPNIAQGYRFQAMALVPLHRFTEAQHAIDEAHARRLDNAFVRRSQLALALATSDPAKTTQALEALRRNDGQNEAVNWSARLAAFDGRWREASDLYRQTLPAAQRAAAQAPLPLEAVGTEALFGLCRPDDRRSAALSRITGPGATYPPLIGPDGSLCGEPSDADRFTDELTRRYPSSTIFREITLPQTRAAAALKRNQPEQAIDALRSFRSAGPCTAGICGSDAFRGFYLRGAAYLRHGRSAEARADFQFILDHRGWGPASPFYPMAYRGLAEASALGGDIASARSAYERLFAMWKSADSDLPVLVAARKAYAALATH
jgi:tetratricopeptide (TPR) repeat protein